MYSLKKARQFNADNGRQFIRNHASDVIILIPALLSAEDHRGARHNGIDLTSIARAVLTSLKRLNLRMSGISTIEQQLVRIIFPRSGRNLVFAKIDELIISYRLSKSLPKIAIWAAYLNCAYYGTDMLGYDQAKKFFCSSGNLTENRAAQIVSCLKYPKPRNPSDHWKKRHRDRVKYTRKRLARQKIW